NLACAYIPVEEKFCLLGWTKTMKTNFFYVTGSGAIGEGVPERIAIGEELQEFQFPKSVVSEDVAFQFVIRTIFEIAPKGITYTAVAFMLLSLMTSAFQDWQYKPEVTYYLYGMSGARKTSISKVLFNMYVRYWD